MKTKEEKSLHDEAIKLKPGEVTEKQVRQIAALISESFFDNPLTIYIFPDPERRKNKLLALMQVYVRYGLKYGELYVTSMNFEGMVMWLPPGSSSIAISGLLAVGLLKALWKAGFRSAFRMVGMSRRMRKYQQVEASFPHWYGFGICVASQHRGQGHVRRLLNPKFEESDKTGVPIYIGTQREQNTQIYRKYGFEVVDERLVPGTGEKGAAVRRWTMLRGAAAHHLGRV